MRARLIPMIVMSMALAASGASEDWISRSEIKYPTGNLSFSSRWAPETGLHLKIVPKESSKSVLVSLDGKNGEIRLSPEKAFSSAVINGSQFNLEALPAGSMDNAEIVLKFRPEAWAIYVENRPVCVFPAPFLPPATLFQPSSELPPEDRRKVKFQKLADFRFQDDFLVPEEEENQLASWKIEAGAWGLHTALDNAVDRENIEADAKKKPKSEFSPNFYSLKGSGTNAIITAGHNFYDAYTVEAAVRTAPAEMGLVFYFRNPGNYHAFTIRMEEDTQKALLRLWRNSDENSPKNEVLNVVMTELTHGQWVKLRVRTFQNRIQCYLDNIKVMDVPAELPVGGKFGLYANSKTRIRFDDVSAASNHDLDFRGVSETRRHVLVENGLFFPRRRFFNLFAPRDIGAFLEPEASKKPQWLVLGAPSHCGHVFSSEFEPTTGAYEIGLLAGFTGIDEPYYRFTCRKSDKKEALTLEKVTKGSATVVEELRLPARAEEKQRSHVSLMADASNEKELRLYRNGQLVLIHHLESELKGASGLYVGPRTGVRISNLSYRFERDDIYRNKFEKNRQYVDDPFMRHWSSPEGQWIEEKNKLVWYKGDFFGRFLARMPFIDSSELHLGVEEGNTNGTLVVKARKDGLALFPGPSLTDQDKPTATVPADSLVLASYDHEDAKEKTTNQWYTVHYEDHWLWITSGDKLLLKHSLERPLEGRRIRIAGFTTNQLKNSYIERFNVKDYLFTDSLHEWVVNGGRWEVINRFQCDPRWSHMNGESKETLAALWTKYDFKGDFCIELYAGLRHGWYERCGDLNVTVMNKDNTPSQGYTITCTGWDFDHSQVFTKFYRNGKLIDKSDKYLAPRIRDGNVRRGYNPLVKGGRDVHGAWYYIKFRRIGKKFEYYFDNELVFSHEDESPIDKGSMGIWTFMNSMMVARVTIAAQKIEPRPIVFSSVPPEPKPGPSRDPHEQFAKYGDLRKDNRLLESCLPANWEIDDPVGRSRITWHEEPGTGPYFALRNVLGGGSMFAECKLPPTPYEYLAGWRFYLKRTPNAEFNFHYSVGRLNDDGEYTAKHSFFHRITGTDFSKGRFKMHGGTDVTAVKAVNENWHSREEWTLVEAWLPTDGLRGIADDTDLLVKVEGFGNLQPSYTLQGLSGNGPGEGYAVKDFSEVRYSGPEFALSTNTPAPLSFSILDWETRKPLMTFSNVVMLQKWADAVRKTGLIRTVLQTDRPDNMSLNDLVWVRRHREPVISCFWSKDVPSAVVLKSGTEYPDRRFAFAKISLGDSDNVSAPNTFDKRLVLLPRQDKFRVARSGTIPVKMITDNKSYSFSLAWKDSPLQEPPVLLKLKGLTPLFENFEQRTLRKPLKADRKRMKISHFDSRQGSYLEVFNRKKNSRLKSSFRAPVQMSHYPLLQFRYRASGMTHVTLSLRKKYYVKLSENYDKARTVRNSHELSLDGQWHTWFGTVSDAVGEHAFNKDLFAVRRIGLGSFHKPDQTGLFTQWSLDDLVLGPAVSKKEQLAFTPGYFDFDGVDKVSMALRAGPESYDELDQKQAASLVWRDIPNGKETAPDPGGLADGICRLFIKASDKHGNESAVTDIPFLLDRKPLIIAHSVEKTENPLSNGTELRVSFESGGNAPLDLKAVKVKWNKKVFSVGSRGSSFTHLPEKDSMVLNWPYIFRHRLNKMKDGQTANIVIANIKDGAGNSSSDIVIPITIDYGNDRIGPALLPTKYPTNILWCSAWEADAKNKLHFKASGGNETFIVREWNEEPYLCTKTKKDSGEIHLSFKKKKKWKPDVYPYFAFRIRRPTMTPDEETRIDILLKCSNNRTYTLSLTHPEDGKDEMSPPNPISWRPNVWHSVILDLGNLLKDKLSKKEMQKLEIESLHFQRKKTADEQPLHLQSVFVFSPWNDADTVELDAYDAGGIDGVTWGNVKDTDDMKLSPASLQDNDRRWLILRARDKAGNLSIPVRVPYPKGNET